MRKYEAPKMHSNDRYIKDRASSYSFPDTIFSDHFLTSGFPKYMYET